MHSHSRPVSVGSVSGGCEVSLGSVIRCNARRELQPRQRDVNDDIEQCGYTYHNAKATQSEEHLLIHDGSHNDQNEVDDHSKCMVDTVTSISSTCTGSIRLPGFW